MLNETIVRELILKCSNFTQLAKLLNRRGIPNIKRFIINKGIDFSHFNKVNIQFNINCKHCNKEFISNNQRQIFCNKSCSAKFNNNRKGTSVSHNKKCKNCNLLLVKRYNQFCNFKCNNEYKQKINFEKIQKGEIYNSQALKQFLSVRDGNKCILCNQFPFHNNLSLILQLDHIDGNSDNNLPNNLRLLCPNCHTQTETFKSRNKKNTKRSKYARLYRKRIQKQIGSNLT